MVDGVGGGGTITLPGVVKIHGVVKSQVFYLYISYVCHSTEFNLSRV